MIDAAERDGLLQPGGTIVEPTSGNTGVGLAIVAAQRGYRCIFVMSDKMSEEKVALLRAYGAEVVVCPTAVPPEHPDSYYSVADRLTRETPGAFRPDQYSNPANPAEHERSTGPEIWRQTDGRVTHFVAGDRHRRHHHRRRAGTSRRRTPAVQIIGADPEGSVYSGGSGRPYLVEGVGEDFWPTTYDPSLVDRTVMVSDAESFAAARRVTREEGLLIGGSCGTAVHAALVVGARARPRRRRRRAAARLRPQLPVEDLRRRLDDALRLPAQRRPHRRRRARGEGRLDPRPRRHHRRRRPRATRSRACASSACRSSSSRPPPSRRSRQGGVGHGLGAAAHGQGVPRSRRCSTARSATLMEPAPPMLGIGETGLRRRRPARACTAVLVLDGGHPVGVLTRSDVLTFLARTAHRCRAT